MKYSQFLAVLLATFLLSACGGGGGASAVGVPGQSGERVGNVPAAVSILPSNSQ